MKRIFCVTILFIIFFIALALCVLFAEADAKEIRDGVLRFHIVANSDSDYDQQNKMSVRDGVALTCSELFYNAQDKQEAMELAALNSDVIESAARDILEKRGCYDKVTMTVRKRFFPTRCYEGVSLPAGVYDTVDIVIGEGQGKNFWCVMFPDICIGSSTDVSNREKMSDILTGDSLEMTVNNDNVKIAFKFKIVELFETFKNKIKEFCL